AGKVCIINHKVNRILSICTPKGLFDMMPWKPQVSKCGFFLRLCGNFLHRKSKFCSCRVAVFIVNHAVSERYFPFGMPAAS
ncbi:MAG: hypothetical protein PHQ23_16625, partial [Candidatus Wallbacteria bacterium]|nr:hypothetical protein [Candidatus Wallbacteria bacterium]